VKYDTWISENYPTFDLCKNKCNEAVRNMVNKFPELKVQVGLANGVLHCWTIDKTGRIVDPTAKQFASPIDYNFIASRFLQKHEYEASTGCVFLDVSTETKD
jgi:hypothetical protein